MRLTERVKSISQMPVHIQATATVSTLALIIGLVALTIAIVAIGSVRRAN